MNKYLPILAMLLMAACTGQTDSTPEVSAKDSTNAFSATIDRDDPALDGIITKDAKPEVIAEGLEWSEGPLWVEDQKMLLFSDVPVNTVYKWTEDSGKQVYLQPSGYTGTGLTNSKEPGSNGLTLDLKGSLVLCQHGNRQVAVMNALLTNPQPVFQSLASSFNGIKFNSPNDCVFNRAGELFFTDPPYGLPQQSDEDSLKRLSFNGVFMVKKDSTIVLLTDTVTRPNGIALFPGDKRLLVASSDPKKPEWYVWDIDADKLANGKVFYSAIGYDSSWNGLPDGLKIDSKGNVFASGPGGIYIFNNKGKKLGLIRLENSASNCALSPDEKTLYITNDMYVLRLKMR